MLSKKISKRFMRNNLLYLDMSFKIYISEYLQKIQNLRYLEFSIFYENYAFIAFKQLLPCPKFL
ncbi:hypothetical protein BpHYR1_023856 [Brachionus plicatilis]|uniref:Uncharacterized protein n=1 Tax=Brachionus plicatilis TaxID=10195 RepID=A0A3M7RW58_BRAPC|nr:hypothetical protein BpHYR1_023856 [Brachionus plicatilis]